jgi:hypothetical protein
VTKRSRAAWGALVALMLTGCGKPTGLLLQRLDPKAPAASGLPALPGPDEPAPLTARAPFGLYAQPPASDTLAKLAQGTISPDGHFRAAMTGQGAWVARVDGAWLWQIALPAPPAPLPPKSSQPGLKLPPPPPTKAPLVVSMEWTLRDTLLLKDDVGVYHEANAEWGTTVQLPLALQGKQSLTFSPDGKQVLYYSNGKSGKQLWIANADGTNPKYQGDDITGSWDEASKLVVVKPKPPAVGAGAPTAPGTSVAPGTPGKP